MSQGPFVVSSSSSWPASSEMRTRLVLPLTLSLDLMRKDLPQGGHSIRCSSCSAFINCHCKILSNNCFQCSLCGCSTQLDDPIQFNAPELTQGSYTLPAKPKSTRITLAVIVDFSDYGKHTQSNLQYSLQAIENLVTAARQTDSAFDIIILGFDNHIHRFSRGEEGLPLKTVTSLEDTEIGNENLFLNTLQDSQALLLILKSIRFQLSQQNGHKSNSSLLLQSVQLGLKITGNRAGSLYVISGLRHELDEFQGGLALNDDIVRTTFNFQKRLLPIRLQSLLASTGMSICFFFFTSRFINLLSFHTLAKVTNGYVRVYPPSRSVDFYYQFSQKLLRHVSGECSYEVMAKVRTSLGVRVITLLGPSRQKGVDQFQLLSCENSQTATFQFQLETLQSRPFTIVQVAVVSSNCRGDRSCSVFTHLQPVTSDSRNVLMGIDYFALSRAYMKGITHQLDASSLSTSVLQRMIEERCKHHFSIVRKELKAQQFLKQLEKIQIYLITSFMMKRNLLLNPPDNIRSVICDQIYEIRSKILTMPNFDRIIWPIVYAVDDDKFFPIQMVKDNFQKGKHGFVVDRGDVVYIYVHSQSLKRQLIHEHNICSKVMGSSQFIQFKAVFQYLMAAKGSNHITVEFIASTQILDVLNETYHKFVEIIVTQ